VRDGNPKALIALGDMLRAGKVVKADPERSIAFYEEAAESGHGGAAVTLGFMFARGDEVAKDVGRAIAYLQQGAASTENAGALKLLGDLYSDSTSAFFDLEKARSSYERALAQNNGSAALALGALALRGDGGGKDFEAAARYYSQAQSLGIDRASRMLGDLYRANDNPGREIYRAAEYYRQAAQNGDEKATLALGSIYARKELSSNHVAEVIGFLSALIDGPSRGEALKLLGDLYALDGPHQDIGLAKESYARAGELGNGSAYLALGDLLRSGAGSDPDLAAAAQAYEQAAKSGVARAYIRLGDLAWKKEGAQPNRVSIYYYALAEQAGDPIGGLRLARVDQSYYNDAERLRAAIERYRIAAEVLGVDQAIRGLRSGDPRGLVGIIQDLLAANGYEVGEVDGLYGVRTGVALRQFCADRKLGDCSGEIETAPLEALLTSRVAATEDAERLDGLVLKSTE
jgi:TPR repeat protein